MSPSTTAPCSTSLARGRGRRCLATGATAALLAGAVALTGASSAQADPGASTPGSFTTSPVTLGTTLQITGHGYGHGRGLSQYGARGAAIDGLSTDAILSFYYPGTTSGQVDAATTLRVRLDDRLAAGGFQATSTVAGALLMTDTGDGTTWSLNNAAAVRVIPVAGGQQMQTGGGGAPWTTVRTLVGTLKLVVTSGAIALTADDGSVRTYAGSVTSALGTSGGAPRVWAVNTVNVEDYLRGVVPSEMPTSWPGAAVRAQAVAARSYALAQKAAVSASSAWDLCSTSACQVYAGVGAATSGGDAAVTATARTVRLSGSATALTEFSSSNGGWTVAGPASRPYLASVPDPYEAASGNPLATWTTSVPVTAIAAAWPSVGTPRSVTVLSRDGNGAEGGRVTGVEIQGDAATLDVTGDAFRSALGLKSTWYSLSSQFKRARKHVGRKTVVAPSPTASVTPPLPAPTASPGV